MFRTARPLSAFTPFGNGAMHGKLTKLWPRQPKPLPKPPMNGTPAGPPADTPLPRLLRQFVTPQEVRELCELVRKRYSLDLDLWGLQNARQRDRDEIWSTIYKADAALKKIRRIVESWDRRDLFESEKDWEKFLDIKARIDLPGKRDWIANPPWAEK